MKKIESTYDRVVCDKKRKANIEKEYQKLLTSELLAMAMEEKSASVRKLAKQAGISPTIVQELRSGKRKNITLATFNRILRAVGYEISVRPIK